MNPRFIAIVVASAVPGACVIGAPCLEQADCLPCENCLRGVCVIDPALDCMPNLVCPTETHACVERAPEGWNGPVALWDGSATEPVPTCLAPWGVDGVDARGDMTTPPDSCGCTCTPPDSDTGCASLRLIMAPQYGVAQLNPLGDWSLKPNGCDDLAGSHTGFFQAQLGLLDDASGCTADTEGHVPPPTWAARTIACGAPPTHRSCANDGQACVPAVVGAPFDDRLCIYASGVLDCPGATYARQIVRYARVEDDRRCAECSCGALDGFCRGVVTLAGGPVCSDDSILVTQITSAAWGPEEYSGVTHARWAAEVDATCEPSSPGVEGTASPAGAVTLCCMR